MVVVASVSHHDERRWSGRLDQLGAALMEIGVDQPVLVGIGKVFAAVQQRQAAAPVERVA